MLNSHIQELEEKLNQAPSSSTKEKATLEARIADLETQLATVELDNIEAMRVTQITRVDLEELDRQVATLTQQKDNLTSTNNSVDAKN